MAVPKAIASVLKAGHAALYREGRLQIQTAVVAFIAEGHYASHILHMRKPYAARREMLVSLVKHRLGKEWLSDDTDNAGQHLVVKQPKEVSDNEAVAVFAGYKPCADRYFLGGLTAGTGVVA